MREAWKRVHAELCRLARSKAAYDVEEAHWLVEGKRARVHEPLGFGTFLEYLERVFGYRPRLASEKLRVAEALEELPVLRQALGAGELSWSAVRELSRVVVEDTEGEWLDAAGDKTVREVEQLVSGRRRGDTPKTPADPGATRHALRYDVSGDTFAALRDARWAIELELGHSIDDDGFLRVLAHRAAGAEPEAGRAPYQVALTVCPQCERGTRDGAGVEVSVEPAVVEAARCDAQNVDMTHVGNERATQDVPPRVRRLVMRRAHGRCQVPGCRAAKRLEIHHLRWRSRGGNHHPDNLAVTCSSHHAAVHRGALRIAGTADNLSFFHADGTVYGAAASVPRPASRVAPPSGNVEVGTTHADGTVYGATARVVRPAPRVAPPPQVKVDALAALRELGVAPGDARDALTDAPADSVEAAVRHGLLRLAQTTYASRCREPASRYAPGGERSAWA